MKINLGHNASEVKYFVIFHILFENGNQNNFVHGQLLTHPKFDQSILIEMPCSTADAKSTPSYSSDLHFSVLKYRPDRGMLICF